MRALTFWPEWCIAFPGVRFADGTPSRLDKPVENRPRAPWSTIAPSMFEPGPWVAMHAGKAFGGGIGGVDGARLNARDSVLEGAKSAGWDLHWITPHPPALNRYRPGHYHEQAYNDGPVVIGLDNIVTSAIVALFRVTRFVAPGIPGPWRMLDRWGWYVEVRPLVRPVPCSGSQGLWTVPPLVEDQISQAAP